MKGFPQPITPLLVATATESGLASTVPFADPNLPAGIVPMYGQDIQSGSGRAAPGGQSVGKTEAELKPKMLALVKIFASGDRNGMASRLFNLFQQKQSKLAYFDDVDLTAAASTHSHIQSFCDAALNAPNVPRYIPNKVRIHQALQKAGWDITKTALVSDLGVPAFNDGKKAIQTGDFNNGLGVMIDAVERVYVLATKYLYDPGSQEYGIELQYRFYDVFGLDDTDLNRFGVTKETPAPSTFVTLLSPGTAIAMSIARKIEAAGVGITAWWQLQHQFGYAPLVTRIIINKTYTVPAK